MHKKFTQGKPSFLRILIFLRIFHGSWEPAEKIGLMRCARFGRGARPLRGSRWKTRMTNPRKMHKILVAHKIANNMTTQIHPDVKTYPDLGDRIRNMSMGSAQWLVVALCVLIAALDGYEIIMMSLLAPTMAKDWGLAPVTLGYLFSASILGMTVGSVAIAPLSDRIGRRNHIIICLLLTSVSMGACAFAQSIPQLLFARTISGLWLGAIIPSLNCFAAEVSSDRQRGAVMGLYGIGLPLGSLVGGLSTGPMIAQWGWQGPFLVCACLSVLMAVIAAALLPESVDYLIQKRPRNALRDYNRLALRYGGAQVEVLPPPRGAASSQGAMRLIFSGTFLKRTLLLWCAYGLVIAAFYFSTTWTPKLVADGTASASAGRTAGVLISLGAIVGTLGFGALSAKWNPRVAAAALLALALPVYLAFANYYSTGSVEVLTVMVGMVTVGGIAALYAITPFVYPAASRATATGLMLGFGRAVSVVVPIFVGYWLQNGFLPTSLYQAFGTGIAVAAVLLYGLHRSYNGRSEDPEFVPNEDRDIRAKKTLLVAKR